LRNKLSAQQKAQFEKAWSDLVLELKAQLHQDPQSDIGIELGGRCMELINGVYGKRFAHLRTKIFEQGYMEGKGLKEVGLTPEIVSWLDKAVDTYWHNRIHSVLAKVGTGVSDETIFNLWSTLLEEMYGENNARKKEIYDLALSDEKVSDEAKEWLKVLRELVIKNNHLI